MNYSSFISKNKQYRLDYKKKNCNNQVNFTIFSQNQKQIKLTRSFRDSLDVYIIVLYVKTTPLSTNLSLSLEL